MATYYAQHRDERLAYQKRYDKLHADDIAVYRYNYYTDTQEKQRAKSVAYNATHKAEKAAYHKAYAATHKDETNARKRKYREARNVAK